jgi:hypothetical protein
VSPQWLSVTGASPGVTPISMLHPSGLMPSHATITRTSRCAPLACGRQTETDREVTSTEATEAHWTTLQQLYRIAVQSAGL